MCVTSFNVNKNIGKLYWNELKVESIQSVICVAVGSEQFAWVWLAHLFTFHDEK